MFTIQYASASGEHKLQEFDSKSRDKLVKYLAGFQLPIMAVYEQASPITKAVRLELRTFKGALSRCAREFAFTTSPA